MVDVPVRIEQELTATHRARNLYFYKHKNRHGERGTWYRVSRFIVPSDACYDIVHSPVLYPAPGTQNLP